MIRVRTVSFYFLFRKHRALYRGMKVAILLLKRLIVTAGIKGEINLKYIITLTYIYEDYTSGEINKGIF